MQEIQATILAPNPDFAVLADDEQIQQAAEALEAHGIRTLIAEDGEEARNLILNELPDGAEVFTASSQTLEQLAIPAELERLGKYKLVRTQLAKMDRTTQGREMDKLGATPEYIIGSVQAVTEDGQVLVASNTGSQLAPYAASAAHVIWVAGAQKIVHDAQEGMRRIEEYALPLEDARLLKAKGVHSSINKVLTVTREVRRNRTTMIIVKEELGY